MTPYLAILNARVRMLLQYRAAALAGVGTQLFWGLIRAMIFYAFYRSSSGPQPMAYDDVVTYVWLGQALLLLLPFQIDMEIRTMVHSGNIAYELIRPLDLYTFWFFRGLAGRTAPVFLRSVPLAAVAMPFLGMAPPASWEAAGAFALAILGAVILSTSFAVLMTITLLWTVSSEGVNGIMGPAVWLLSGSIVPLPLYPQWAQEILNVLPFRGLADIPFRLYLGHLPPDIVPGLLLHQLLWSAALIALGRFILSRGTRRLVVQGG